MSMKRFYYTDVDGDHFPDATLGDDLFYTLDLDCWLENQGDELISATWELPPEVTSTDHFIEGTKATIQLKASRPGSFRIKCTAKTKEHAESGAALYQEKSMINVLKVYN